MRTHPREIRCSACRILLAKIDETGALVIVRNGMEAHTVGQFRMSIVCYRSRCRRLNVISIPSDPVPVVEAA